IVVPTEAVADDTVQVVNNSRVQRLPVRIGVRGSRNVEIIGEIMRGMAVLSPARPDLADGTLAQVRRKVTKPAPKSHNMETEPASAQDQATTPAAGTKAPAHVAASDPDLA